MTTHVGTLAAQDNPSPVFTAYKEKFDLSLTFTVEGNSSGNKVELQRNIGGEWKKWKEYTADAEEVVETSGMGRAYRLVATDLDQESDDATNYASVAYAFGGTY